MTKKDRLIQTEPLEWLPERMSRDRLCKTIERQDADIERRRTIIETRDETIRTRDETIRTRDKTIETQDETIASLETEIQQLRYDNEELEREKRELCLTNAQVVLSHKYELAKVQGMEGAANKSDNASDKKMQELEDEVASYKRA